ncbi:ABC transporter substrate-binding protein [Paenibacillus sepulcri]|uniref:ABC transporter substrate-binding protein n=1 Tax=Paenibacillus sepulcri TaxID=359917 RepID=A0ABS7C321_9BACL|nr:ABC transporter substrate-binding protein [Paenibacillus sepulcri]
MKRIIGGCLTVLLVCMCVWGCAGSGSGTNDSPTANGGGSEEGAAAKTVQLTYWMHQNDAFVPANKKLVADFEKANPDISIKVEVFPYDDYVQKIRTSYIGNAAPDVAQVFGTWVTPLAKAGLLAEVPNGGDLLANYYPAATGAYTVDGKLYGVPQEFNLGNGGILVNTDYMQKAGVQVPATWSELVDAARKMTEYDANNEIKVRGFDFVSSDSITFLFLSMILQQGATYWTDDDMINFSTPEAVHAFTEMRNLITEDKVTDTKLLGGKLSIFDYFFKGQTAMDFDGPWVIPSGIATYGNTVKFDYVPMPSFTDQPPYFAAESGWGEVISAKSKNIEAASKFVQFLTTNENNNYWNTQTGTLPPSKDQLTDQFIQNNPLVKPSLNAMQFGQWIGPVENTDYLKKVLVDALVAVVKGDSVETTLKKAETDVNKNIVKERK